MFIFAFIGVIATFNAANAVLYSVNDAVIILSKSNFPQVFGSEYFWLVELYNSGCPHCMMYAATYRELARTIVDWSAIVKIAALDCADSVNVVFCSQQGLFTVPTFRLYAPLQQTTTSAEVLGEQPSAEVWKQLLLSRLADHVPPFKLSWWPQFRPFNALAPLLASLNSAENSKAKAHFIVVEFTDAQLTADSREWLTSSRIGMELQLAFSSALQSSTARIHRLFLPNGDSAAKQQLLTTLSGNRRENQSLVDFEASFWLAYNQSPAQASDTSVARVYQQQPDGLTYHLVGISDMPSLKGTLKQILQVRVPSDFLEEQLREVPDGGLAPESIGGYFGPLPLSSADAYRIHMQDLESCIYYMFTREIPLASKISGERFDALARFLQVLGKYFIGREPVMRFLRSLATKLHEYSSDLGLSGTEWLWVLVELQQVALHRNEFLPAPVTLNGVPQLWSGCAAPYGAHHRGGYSCALWQLFHVLTVSHWLAHTDSLWRPSYLDEQSSYIVQDSVMIVPTQLPDAATTIANAELSRQPLAGEMRAGISSNVSLPPAQTGLKPINNAAQSLTRKKSSLLVAPKKDATLGRSLLSVNDAPDDSIAQELHAPSADVAEVLLAFRGYVINFFACSECKENFRTETAMLDQLFRSRAARGSKLPASLNTKVASLSVHSFTFRNYSESVLYAWALHNDVNARLARQGHQHPSRPKVPFPPASLCPSCRLNKSAPVGVATPDKTAAETEIIGWNLDELLVFFRSQLTDMVADAVGVRNINSILHNQLNLETPDGDNWTYRIVAALGFFLSPGDVTLIFCVYALIFCVLAVLYLYFIYRCRHLSRARRLVRSLC